MTRPSDPSPAAHPWFTATGTPRVLAHRGLVSADAARDGVTENSFAAVAAAHAAGVGYVESDCHLTADGVVVLFHDDDLSRVTGDPRRIADVRVRELEALMSDRGGLLTLPQALEAFPDLRWNLDVKATAAATPVGIGVARDTERVLITSFSDDRRREALAAATRLGAVRPATSAGRSTIVRLLAAVASGSSALVARVLSGIDAVQIPERHAGVAVLSDRLLRLTAAAGVEVHVWTVNDPSTMRNLVRRGVQGIVTDRADDALRALDAPDRPRG